MNATPAAAVDLRHPDSASIDGLNSARDLLTGNGDRNGPPPSLQHLVWVAVHWLHMAPADLPLSVIREVARHTRTWHPLPDTEPVASVVRKIWKEERARARGAADAARAVATVALS